MLHHRYRKLMKDERGQALVIGAISLLVMAIVVLASASIGNAVYEKIKLQDAVDAQAYTLAVKHARAYNFFAYTNRAMVVHYCAMLTFMSYLSHAWYLKHTVANIANWLSYIPYIGPIFRAIEQIIEWWHTIVDTVVKVLIPVLTALNIGLWLAQEGVLMATLADSLVGSGAGPLSTTDPKARVGFDAMGGGVLGLLSDANNWVLNYKNAKNFLHPIDDAVRSSDNGLTTGTSHRAKLVRDNNLSDAGMAKYRLLMGNIANGSRRKWTAQGMGPILLGRRWSLTVPFIVKINKTAESQIKSFWEEFDDNRKDQLSASEDIVIKTWRWSRMKWRTWWTYQIRVAADNQDGYHRATLASGSCEEHPWLGITPYILADPSFYTPWKYHFGYPCSMVVATKDMIGGTARPFELETKVDANHGTAENSGVLSMSWKNVGGPSQLASTFRQRTGGMMAVAVGRAVYHRPGDWKEQPNFFNPLWNARLAPLVTHWESDALKALMPEITLVNSWFGSSALNY
ncbi:MAG: TadE/TadG family type IV pilus assembly protein [Myxococcales bacterium]|jgi:hypothetical protein